MSEELPPGFYTQIGSDRPELERMTKERWGEHSIVGHLNYNALLLYWEYGPNWLLRAPKREVEFAVALNTR